MPIISQHSSDAWAAALPFVLRASLRRSWDLLLLTFTSLARVHMFSVLSLGAFLTFGLLSIGLFFNISCIYIKYILIITIILLWKLAKIFQMEETFFFFFSKSSFKNGPDRMT